MKYKQLGNTDLKMSAIGFGGMPLSIKKDRPTEAEAIKVIHAVLDLGVTLIDTADAYCLDETEKHHNERIIGAALKSYCRGGSPWPPKDGQAQGPAPTILVATKGGLMRPNGDWVCNGNPDHLWKTIHESKEALGRPIDLWQFHAPDPKFDIKESLRSVKESVKAGLVQHVGVSNFSVDQIREAQDCMPIVSVQNQYNWFHKKPETDGVLKYCEENKLTFFPWSPLGGMDRAPNLGKRGQSPLLSACKIKGVSPQRYVLAWMLHKWNCIVPIPGASRVETITDSIAAVDVELHT